MTFLCHISHRTSVYDIHWWHTTISVETLNSKSWMVRNVRVLSSRDGVLTCIVYVWYIKLSRDNMYFLRVIYQVIRHLYVSRYIFRNIKRSYYLHQHARKLKKQCMSGYLFLVVNKSPSLPTARPHRHRGHKKASETDWLDWLTSIRPVCLIDIGQRYVSIPTWRKKCILTRLS